MAAGAQSPEAESSRGPGTCPLTYPSWSLGLDTSVCITDSDTDAPYGGKSGVLCCVPTVDPQLDTDTFKGLGKLCRLSCFL